MEEAESSSSNSYLELQKWLSRVAGLDSEDASNANSIRVQQSPSDELNEESVSIIAVDLDGFLDSANGIRNNLMTMLETSPNWEQLETVLVELEIQLAHSVQHWRSIAKNLRDKEWWLAEYWNASVRTACRDHAAFKKTFRMLDSPAS